MCHCNGVDSFLCKFHKALKLGVSFAVLPVLYNSVDGHFLKYCGFVRQRIREICVMQLTLQLIRNCVQKERYHYFMKISYPKYLYIMNDMPLITLTFVIMDGSFVIMDRSFS